MRIAITILLVLFSFCGFGQEISIDLPVNSPQSPTTNDLGKYGEVQVNESTGIISPSIPLFEYKAGPITIPIALNYSGNGVRVNQDPTWAGVNWNINPGGVITRVVKDRVDELTGDSQRLYLSEEDLNSLDGVRNFYTDGSNHCRIVTSTDWFWTMKQLVNETYDSEVDIFNYNFMGYSGSFYLDKDNNAHLVKYDKEIEITFILVSDNKSTIIIRTPNGDSYFFGGEFASESSKTWVNIGAGSTVNTEYAQNAFYLNRISFLNGGEINFEYDIKDLSNRLFKIGINESASVGFPLGNFPCNKTVKTVNGEFKKIATLKKIRNSFTEQEVVFQSSSYGISDRFEKLNSIEFKKGNAFIKKVYLEYLTLNNEEGNLVEEQKFFLSKIKFHNSDLQFEHDYEFTYETPGLFPSRESFAQDHLGYYNGKTTNTTLLPRSTNVMLNQNCGFGLANREADLESSKIGTLTQIKYPTGGTMNFEYELPYKGQEDIIEDHFITAYFRDPNRGNTSSSYFYDGNLHTYSSAYYPNVLNPLVLASPKIIDFNLNVVAQGAFTAHNNVTIYVLKPVSGGFQIVDSYEQRFTTETEITQDFNINESFALPAGSYVFKIVVNLNNGGNSSNYSVVANCNLKLPNGTRNAYHPGLRIKRVTTTAAEDDLNPNIVRYYYNDLLHLNDESYQFHPNYVYTTAVVMDGPMGQLTASYNLSTNSVKNIFNNDMGNVYQYVTVSYGGDGFEKGGKQSTFYKYSNYPPTTYDNDPCNPIVPDFIDLFEIHNFVDVGDNDSFPSSVLKEEKFFNSDPNHKTLKITTYNYDSSVNNRMDNVKTFTYGPTHSDDLGGIIYFLYKTRSHNYRLLSTETKEYFGANLTDEVGSTTTYQYTADKVSLPSVIQSTNSFGQTKRTNIFYPSDVASIGTLSGNDISALNTLTNKHNVSQLVKTESLANGQLLETKQISFVSSGATVLPKIIKTSKGNGENALEDRVEILSYYFGQPSLVKLTDGTRTKYEYNSNLQVVLKIENYALNGSIDPIEIPDPEENRASNEGSCEYADLYPNSLVTKYDYDSKTKSLIRVTDPKCNVTTYEYDEFNRLKQVKDHNGHVLSENEYHYKP